MRVLQICGVHPADTDRAGACRMVEAFVAAHTVHGVSVILAIWSQIQAEIQAIELHPLGVLLGVGSSLSY